MEFLLLFAKLCFSLAIILAIIGFVIFISIWIIKTAIKQALWEYETEKKQKAEYESKQY